MRSIPPAATLATVRAPGAIAGTLSPGGEREIAADGLADAERGVPIEPGTPMRIGSITKTFTSAAALLLVERGALALDDPAVAHLPELRALRTDGHRLEDVTVRRLLLHAAGLVGEPPTRDWLASPFPSIAEVLERIDLASVAIAPGSAFKYSNLGYALLGEIVARAAGAPWERVVRDALLEPAGMAATTFAAPAGSARGHAPAPGGTWAARPFQELGGERPAGGARTVRKPICTADAPSRSRAWTTSSSPTGATRATAASPCTPCAASRSTSDPARSTTRLRSWAPTPRWPSGVRMSCRVGSVSAWRSRGR